MARKAHSDPSQGSPRKGEIGPTIDEGSKPSVAHVLAAVGIDSVAGAGSEGEPRHRNEAEATLQDIAKRILRGEMARRRVSYRDLAAMLAKEGIQENELNLKKKITRGTFSAAYFVGCLRAMDCKSVDVDLPKLRYSVTESGKLTLRKR